MKRSILTLLVAAFSITTITSLAFSQEHKHEQGAQKMMQEMGMMQHKPGESISLVGEVIDTGCYLRGGMKGEKHVQCAQMCADAGIPLGILDETTNNIFLPIPKMGKNPNEQLKTFIGQRVVVTGEFLEKGGLNGIDITKIEKSK